MDQPVEEVPTDLVDLTDVTFRQLQILDRRMLAPSLSRVRGQVQRSRANMAESGPPGRAD